MARLRMKNKYVPFSWKVSMWGICHEREHNRLMPIIKKCQKLSDLSVDL